MKPLLAALALATLPVLSHAEINAAAAAAGPVHADTKPLVLPPGVTAIDIAPAWAGSLVEYRLLTQGDQQFVAFYDPERRMTIGQRTLGSTTWKFKTLPSVFGWDGHNYTTLALDRDNILHVSGNMHISNKMIYFRASKPLDIDSLEAASMTGKGENSVTYPSFIKGPDGELIFIYRDGSSGKGDNIFNVYDEKSQTWSRLLDKPLMEGANFKPSMNAYFSMNGPYLGPDGWFHAIWVWRNQPNMDEYKDITDTTKKWGAVQHDAAQLNHDFSYIRSKDLKHWETVSGQPLELPITPTTPGVVVDPIPIHGGILNGGSKIGFGPNNQLILSYYKYDDKGSTQLFLATPDKDAPNGWRIVSASDWTRWGVNYEYNVGYAIRQSPPQMVGGKLVIQLGDNRKNQETWEIDPATLKLKALLPEDYNQYEPGAMPPEYGQAETVFPRIQVNWASDLNPDSGSKFYRLRWESLLGFHDRPQEVPWPDHSMLRLIEIPRKQQ